MPHFPLRRRDRRRDRLRGQARPWLAVATAVGLFAALSPFHPPSESTPAQVAPELVAEVRAASAGEPVQALVMLPNAELSGDRDEVLTTLRDHAAETQADVTAAIGETATVVNRFWLTNMLLVEFPADTDTLTSLAAVPGIARLIPNFELTAPEPAPSTADVTPAAELTWGLQKIEAARAWQELGVDGSGVRIATLDTGVDITHPDLAGKMVTDNPADPDHPGGWMEFNASGGLVTSAPHDSAYHGTHVAGTIHGGATSGTAIGVAPGAEMMHGLVIPGGGGSFAQVAAGMQWAVAPTDATGAPAGRPADIVSMSLGGNGFHQEMIQPTRAIRALGSFPAFAIGNNCGSIGTASPGNVFESVAVGATDGSDNVASFSCGGVVRKNQWADPPADWPESWVKPDISAPGVDVYSASPGGGYRTLSGTSMATPHTAGTVALMLSAAGDLPVTEVLDVLADTAFWDDRYATAPPDTRFGRGRINAYEAARFVALDSGVEGTVTDAATGAPVSGATATIEPGGRRVTTGADGRFTTRLEPGDYTITTEAFGYDSATVDTTVAADSFATVDVALTALPSGQVTGKAVLDASGAGLPGATVKVLGVPTDLSATTGTDGGYTIAGIPAGTYRVAATHPVFRAPAQTEVTVTAGQATTADFTFGVPPRSVAIVDSSATRAAEYRDVVFAPRGIDTAIYGWDQLDQAARHATVVLGYGTLSNYNQQRFEAFLDATDASGAGVIFTDHAYTTGNGIRQLSRHTGQPVSTGSNTGGSGSAESFYEVTAEHPLLAGYAVGDRIPIDVSSNPKWAAWFTGYEGEGRQTIAGFGRTADGVLGGGIGVDQRANNRHVLLSLHGVSATRGPADWTPEATDLFLNSVTWASPAPDPNQAYYALSDLRVSPGVVKASENVTVTAQVKNVGKTAGTYNAELEVGGAVEATTPVQLSAGQSKTVTWTVDPDRLGTFAVRVEYLTGSFRVRAPRVDLVASTVDAPGAAAVGGLGGATVELIAGGAVRPLGTTDAAGRLSFEIPDPVGRYTVVVRRPTPEGGGDAYLLHREITVIDDDTVSFAPRVLASGARASVGENFAVRANIALDAADARHTGSVFLRPEGTAPHGYRYEPGTLVATLDRYEAVTVHSVAHLEQDWFLPSTVVGGLDWVDPYDVSFSFGGPAQVSVGDVVAGADGQATVDWSVTDAHGVPFATIMASDVRPFLTLPERAALEDVEGLVRAAVPNELKPVLRLFAPDGTPVRAGAVDWDARPFTFTLAPGTPDGAYRLALDVDTGGYSGDLTGEASLRVGSEPVAEVAVTDTRGSFVPGTHTQYDVRAVNSGTADSGPMAWTVRIAAGHTLAPKDVVLRLRVGSTWQRVTLTRDGGALTGTVVADAAVAAGSEQTWRMSLLLRTAGTYTVTDTFSGTGVSVTNADELLVAEPVGVR
ncbi:S8 family serine peptidase [Actinophytocola algeriensis]|uniref:alpha-amylase n=1 Tax=Actinophytocola algeriensis TaxID=1768010 RepID=A0A7W7Q1K0_9PSEU|nr:S8 family serine peptidase [Actinophytocola algeriensis]MBB4905126.1 subtilisin family serine protease [Actinophytocola algeriensis]MBE1473189.1 subtilisin family serine protease [Actinophytocola algeriensis]